MLDVPGGQSALVLDVPGGQSALVLDVPGGQSALGQTARGTFCTRADCQGDILH